MQALAEIRTATHIEQVFLEVRSDSIVLMDVDETLIEPSIMLGSKAWRDDIACLLKKKYPSQKVQDLRDKMTYWITKRVPSVAVEKSIHGFLDQLKEKRIPVCGFTSRTKKQWNSLPCDDGEEVACMNLKQAGFDLTGSSQFLSDGFLTHPSFAQGLFFSYYFLQDKGTLALEIFAQSRPNHVVFVDDRWDNVDSMNRACAQLNIPALCFYYPHIELYRAFDPIVAAIQLEKLYFHDLLLTDEEASVLKTDYLDSDIESLILEIFRQLDL